MAGSDQPSCYAVIFESRRTADDAEGYAAMAEQMVDLASRQPGFLAMNSVRGEDGSGITVSYWRDVPSIKAWKEIAEHQTAQSPGREKWYRSFTLRICRVEDEYSFDRSDD
jgi:heme-degrading monooxygenase HmoA